jgi:3-polyprenyl-4-hydroxybenzoate decarboxylase
MAVGVLDLPVEEETLRRLELLGFERLEQLRVLSIEDLTLQFGREGRVIWERCRGIDETPAEPATIADIVDHTVGRALDLFELDHSLVTRWN